jgi:hypothetical protein
MKYRDYTNNPSRQTGRGVVGVIAVFDKLLLDCPSSVSKVAMTAYFSPKVFPRLICVTQNQVAVCR